MYDILKLIVTKLSIFVTYHCFSASRFTLNETGKENIASSDDKHHDEDVEDRKQIW